MPPLLIALVISLTALPARAQTLVPEGARLAWEMDVAVPHEARANQYVLYVDGVGMTLDGVSCGAPGSGAVAQCHARLPALSPGRHVLQVSARRPSGNTALESERSAPFHVLVPSELVVMPTADTAALSQDPPLDRGTNDGEKRQDQYVVATGLRMPVDIAVVTDDVVLIAERGGTVRAFSDGHLLDEPLLSLPDVIGSPASALLSVALDSDFSTNGLFYVVTAVTTEAGGLSYRLERFHYSRGVMSQRVVLLDGIPAHAASPAAVVRTAGDGTLYAVFGADPAASREVAGSYSGTLVRMTRDGRTPRDHPDASPIVATDFIAPLGLGWNPDSSTVWVIEGGETTRVRVVRHGGDGRGNASLPIPTTLSPSLTRSGTWSAGDHRNHLLVIADDGVQAMKMDPQSPLSTNTIAAIHANVVAAARVVVGTPAGVLYVATSDRLFRFIPER